MTNVCRPILSLSDLEVAVSDRGDARLTWTPAGEASLHWELRLAGAQGAVPLETCCAGECIGRDLRLPYNAGDVEVLAHVAVEGRSGCAWTLTLTNNGTLPVDSLTGILTDIRLSGAPMLTVPFGAGWAVPLEALAEAGPAQHPITLDYPVQGAMQWTSIYTEAGGLYFGVHDPLPLYKQLVAGGTDLTVAWRFADLALGPGETLVLPPVVLACHGDGWRGGAALYRGWAADQIRSPDTPAWVRRAPSWGWVGMKGQFAARPWHTAADLPSISVAAAAAGIDLIQITAYSEDGHDTRYPDYVPGESVGGVASFRRAIAAIHRAGRRASIYVNGRLVDPASALSPEVRAAWAVRPALGALPSATETYGAVTFDVMCPGAAGWRRHFLDRLTKLVRMLDVDGVYIDQVCGCRSLPCYATNHDHDRPNAAWAAYRGFMAEVRSHLRALNPDLFLATEGVSDLLGESFDLFQAHNDWSGPLAGRGTPLPELFRTTFPGKILNAGCIRDDDAGLALLRVAHVAGGGCDFGVADWAGVTPQLAVDAAFVLQWRARHADVLAAGRVLPVDTAAPGIRALAYAAPDGVVVNGGATATRGAPSDDAVELVVVLPYGATVATIEAVSSGGPVPVGWHQAGTAVTLGLPRQALFGIVLRLS